MHSRSSCAKIATVRRCSSVPARKIRTAISLRFAAISFRIGRRARGSEDAGEGVEAAVAAASLEDAEDFVDLVGIWAKAAGFRAMSREGEGAIFAKCAAAAEWLSVSPT